jgi:hypothetical protein
MTMTEEKKAAVPAPVLGWRSLAVSVVAVVAASGLALLLIPQLSLRATIRGATISLGALLVSRLGVWLYVRSQSRR